MREQRTLRKATVVEGVGYWSGANVRVEFRPAPPNSGIAFVRSDLTPPRKIPASVSRRADCPRRTNLTADDGRVEMVEHVLAACAGLRLDNCEIWVDQPEIPGVDGSSLPFVRALQNAGFVSQGVPRGSLVIRRPLRVAEGDAWVEARPLTDGGSAATRSAGLTVEYQLELRPPIGRQSVRLAATTETFVAELAAARTFLLEEEAVALQQQGLGSRVSYQDLLVFDEEGPIENELRFPDECARHKALDLIGDLALTGYDLVGEVTACRSGHRLNAALASELVQHCELSGGRRRIA